MDDDFDQFCRHRFEMLNKILDAAGYIAAESFESYKISNYESLWSNYINSMDDRTIH